VKGLNYRSPVGDGPGTFAQWLRDLRNQSGAYVIRSKDTREVFYVGESHTGNLYKTITRHFHKWQDTRGWFAEDFPHHNYSRHHVEVAIRRTPPKAAIGTQDNLIQRLGPRDNSQCGGCENPF